MNKEVVVNDALKSDKLELFDLKEMNSLMDHAKKLEKELGTGVKDFDKLTKFQQSEVLALEKNLTKLVSSSVKKMDDSMKKMEDKMNALMSQTSLFRNPFVNSIDKLFEDTNDFFKKIELNSNDTNEKK